MGNQQVNPLRMDVGWMAGIIDGEGWIILNQQMLPSNNYRYVPVIGVNATSKLMIDHIQEICRKWNIGTWIGLRKFSGNVWKDQYMLKIYGIKRVNMFLKIITPHLVVKQRQALVLQEYITHRLSISNYTYVPCGAEGQAAFIELQRLNKKGKTSTTK